MISLLEMLDNIQIYCDMDGVLVDFDKSARKIGFKGPLPGKTPEEKQALWDTIINNAESFWGDATWLKDGKTLWNFIKPYNPTLLTSVSQSLTNKLGRNGKKGKERWVKRELGKNQLNRLIVVASKGKTKYANNKSILIDDHSSNIDPWVKAGGIGILHKSAIKTIFQLRKILKG